MNWFRRLRHRPFFIRLFHWEYWSFNTIYIPIYIVWVFLCIRARSFFFFAASNPKIKNAGFLNESKKDIYALVPGEYQPKTAFFFKNTALTEVERVLEQESFHFPLIGKPDIGGRGRGIKKLNNREDLRLYAAGAIVDYHIQAFIAYEKEVGIFYCRYPDQELGMITGIVRKKFLQVTGDGNATVRELLLKNTRAILQLSTLQKTEPQTLEIVLPMGKQQIILPYGNHARGAEFLDDTGLVNEALTNCIDRICKKIPLFYFGRLDIRYDNWDDLQQGKRFSIIEVNGAGSEPTHIYDPKHSLFFAWKEIIRHWILLWRISRVNHKKGYAYLSLQEGISMFREDRKYSKRLQAMQ